MRILLSSLVLLVGLNLIVARSFWNPNRDYYDYDLFKLPSEPFFQDYHDFMVKDSLEEESKEEILPLANRAESSDDFFTSLLEAIKNEVENGEEESNDRQLSVKEDNNDKSEENDRNLMLWFTDDDDDNDKSAEVKSINDVEIIDLTKSSEEKKDIDQATITVTDKDIKQLTEFLIVLSAIDQLLKVSMDENAEDSKEKNLKEFDDILQSLIEAFEENDEDERKVSTTTKKGSSEEDYDVTTPKNDSSEEVKVETTTKKDSSEEDYDVTTHKNDSGSEEVDKEDSKEMSLQEFDDILQSLLEENKKISTTTKKDSSEEDYDVTTPKNDSSEEAKPETTTKKDSSEEDKDSNVFNIIDFVALSDNIDQDNHKYEIIESTSSPFTFKLDNSLNSNVNDNDIVHQYVKLRADLDTEQNEMSVNQLNLDKDFYNVISGDYAEDGLKKFERDVVVLQENVERIKRHINGMENLNSKLYFKKLITTAIHDMQTKTMDSK